MKEKIKKKENDVNKRYRMRLKEVCQIQRGLKKYDIKLIIMNLKLDKMKIFFLKYMLKFV